jgi:hypothetical protein
VPHVVPEPEQDLAEPLDLRGPPRFRRCERDTRQDPVLVEQDPVRSWTDHIKVVCPEEVELELGAAGQDREGHVVVAEILEEQRVADRAHKGISAGDHVRVRLVAHDHAEIDVRVLIGLTTRERSAEEHRGDAIVSDAGSDQLLDHCLCGLGDRTHLSWRFAGGVQMYGVVVVTETKPMRSRIGRLSDDASTWRKRKPRAAARLAR